MSLRRDPPESSEAFRQALYAGAIFQLPATVLSLRLVADVVAGIGEELGSDIRSAQFRHDGEDFFERVGRLRKRFYTEPEYHDRLRALVRSARFDPRELAFDPMRLRVIAHRGHENLRAAPIYFAHRDTWYAHSQAEISWWIPLHDVAENETFVFYPDWFACPVSNNSEAFDHDAWVKNGAALRIGWQNREHGATHHYPGHTGELRPGRVISFAARAGEIVLFSGAHFHQTLKQATGRTRFSLDFRTVDLADHQQGRGAPNVDNRSTGSATSDYVQPQDNRGTARFG